MDIDAMVCVVLSVANTVIDVSALPNLTPQFELFPRPVRKSALDWLLAARLKSGPPCGGRLSAFFEIFVGDQPEDFIELSKSGIRCVHQGVAAKYRGNFSDPGPIFLSVENSLVIFQLHGSRPSIRQTE